MVFDRGLRGKNAASRVLGVGHTLFDIALDEARALLSGIAEVEEILTPLLIVSVEDEVTGTGALVNRLIFGVTEQEEEVAVLRDWELLKLLNSSSMKSAGSSAASSHSVGNQVAIVAKLKQAFDLKLSTHAPAMLRPVSWQEMLLLPATRAQS